MYSNVRAIVLSARRSGEKDKRLVLYTREHGRLFSLAMGATRAGAKLGPCTEAPVEASLRLWREEGAASSRVTGGGVETAFPGLRARWDRMAAAQVLCEWTDRLTPLAEPQPAKYELLRRALSALETEAVDPVRLAFQVQFLVLAGYNPFRDVPGLSTVDDGASAVEALAGYGFEGAPPALPAGLPAPYLQQQLLKFTASLTPRPLRSAVHEESLKAYYTANR